MINYREMGLQNVIRTELDQDCVQKWNLILRVFKLRVHCYHKDQIYFCSLLHATALFERRHRTSLLSGQRSCFVFGRSPVQISPRAPADWNKVIRGFPQFLKTIAGMKMTVCWDPAHCALAEIGRRFRAMTETVSSSETSANLYESTWRYIPEVSLSPSHTRLFVTLQATGHSSYGWLIAQYRGLSRIFSLHSPAALTFFFEIQGDYK